MDLIYAGRYTEVCDYAWHDWQNKPVGEWDLPSGIWHVDTSSIPEFFSAITNMFNKYRKYIVVSPSCDFCVCEQRYNHPAYDLEKWVGLQASPGHGYDDLHLAARINRGRCRESDRYSIKCWSYTEATFNRIPDNVVRWFLVNCEIQDERLIPIPFGIFGNKDVLESAIKIDNYPKLERDKLLYVNFQFYTTDRFRIYQHFAENYPNVVTCVRGRTFDEFLHDLATHKFVLCPTGNGYDCYRTLETIYMGAIPILEKKMGAVAPYMDVEYPKLVTTNLFSVDPQYLLLSMYNRMMDEWYPLEEIRL